MLLGDILNYCPEPVDFNSPEMKGYTKKYLVISTYRNPFVYVTDKYPPTKNENEFEPERRDFVFIVVTEKVNIDYLCYYLILNRYLFKKNHDLGEKFYLDNLTVEFILGALDDYEDFPNTDKQNALADHISNLYEMTISSIDREIRNRIYKISKYMEDIDYSEVSHYKGSEIYEVIDNEKFFKNILKGKSEDPIEEYINILKPDKVYGEYLVHYLFYNEKLLDYDNYINRKYNINEFKHDEVCLDLPDKRSTQREEMYDVIFNKHYKLKELYEKRRQAKLALREIMHQLSPNS